MKTTAKDISGKRRGPHREITQIHDYLYARTLFTFTQLAKRKVSGGQLLHPPVKSSNVAAADHWLVSEPQREMDSFAEKCPAAVIPGPSVAGCPATPRDQRR